MKIYVDSNVFISIINGDFGKSYEFMDLRSIDFLKKSSGKGYDILISDLVLEEFKKVTKLTDNDFYEILLDNKVNYTLIEFDKNDIELAETLVNKFVKGDKDALHAGIALNRNCELLCTWNKKDFEKLESSKYKILIRTPTEL